jgi:hypothetical protein
MITEIFVVLRSDGGLQRDPSPSPIRWYDADGPIAPPPIPGTACSYLNDEVRSGVIGGWERICARSGLPPSVDGALVYRTWPKYGPSEHFLGIRENMD